MSATEAQKKAIRKYQEGFDRIRILVPKGQKKAIEDYAAANGESMTAFILRVISEEMERNSKVVSMPKRTENS